MFWEIVLMIPVAGIVAGTASDMHKRRLKFREKELELTSRDTAERAAQYAARTERLESRVAVLEHLLTDRSTLLSDEIERLRDRPLN